MAKKRVPAKSGVAFLSSGGLTTGSPHVEDEKNAASTVTQRNTDRTASVKSGVPKPRKGGKSIFASALDALDAIGGEFVGAQIEPPTSVEGVARKVIGSSPLGMAANALVGGKIPEAIGEAIPDVNIPAKKLVDNPFVAGMPIRVAPLAAKGIGKLGEALGAAPVAGEVGELVAGPPGMAIGYALSSFAEKNPESAVGRVLTSKKTGKPLTLGEQQDFFKDVASRPNKYVDVSAKDKSIPKGVTPGTKSVIEAALDGNTAAIVQSVADQNKDFFVSPVLDRNLRQRAVKNGWGVDNWGDLTPGEKITQAYTEYSYWTSVLRNAVMAVGATASTPAAIKAIVEGVASAPKDDGAALKEIVNGMLLPYQQAAMVARRDGLEAGLSTAFRDNPVDFVLAASGAVKALGAAGGAGARAGLMGERAKAFAQVNRPVVATRTGVLKNVETPLVQEPFRFTPGTESTLADQYKAYAARGQQLAEEARVAREAGAAGTVVESTDAAGNPIRLGVDEKGVPVRVESKDIAPSAIVGYTEANILSPIKLELNRFIAERSKFWMDRMQKKSAQAYTRREANVVQGIGVQIEQTLSRALGRFPTDAERQRAAFELTWARETLGGRPVTPGMIADYFAEKISDLETKVARSPRKAKKDEAQLSLWRSAEADWRKVDEATLSPETITRLRETAAPLKAESDKLIAAALGMDLNEAKRGNYIRLLVIDPEFEVAARALRAERGTSMVDMVVAQRRARGLADRVLVYASEEGWGKYGKSKSLARFRKTRDDLVRELRRVEREALRIGEKELADQYRGLREQLVLARAGKAERSVDLANQIRAIEDLTAPVSSVPEAARGAYAAAVEAAGALPAAEQRAAGAMGEALTTRGKPFAVVPSARDIGTAENAVIDARDALARAEGLPKPIASDVAKKQASLAKAEERLAKLREASATSGEVVSLRATRDEGVAAAKKLVESGETILDTGQVRAAIDASGEIAAVRIKKPSAYGYYTLKRARGEVLDDFIARVEANDQGAMLHLVQKGDIIRMDRIEIVAPRMIDTGPRGGIRKGRFIESKGALFAMGGEDTANMWKNLMFDTSELIAADTWRRKMQQMIELVGVRVKVGESAYRDARERAEVIAKQTGESLDMVIERELELVLNQSHEFALGDFKLLNTGSPNAKAPAERVFAGTAADEFDPDTVAGLMWKEVNARTIDPNAPTDYFIIPRAVYDGIQKSLRDEAFTFKPSQGGVISKAFSSYRLDQVTRAWRTLTLNVLPKTAFANITGSATLAFIGGATPRSMYYAFRAIMSGGEKMPIPRELQQRYFDPLTARVTGRTKGTAIAAYWINGLRRLNSASEDFARLAVWYSKAYPEAMKQADGSRFMWRAKGLNDDAKAMLEAMANDDPEWRALNQAWMQKSFDFLGDLHRGGAFASKLRIAIPFWQWYAHMLKLTFFTMPVKYPGRALMLQQLGEIGDEYQRTHGVMIPWGEDLIPLFTDETFVGKQPQWVTTAITTSNWYPFATVSPLGGREGESNVYGFVRGAANPIATNATLILASLALVMNGGRAVEYSDRDGFIAAKNEYGNEITSISSMDFLNYVANKVGMAVPLSPVIMSQAGRSDTSTLWNQTDTAKKGPQIEKQRYDVLAALDDPWSGTSLGFLARAVFGVQLSRVPGIGPVERVRLLKMLKADVAQMNKEQSNIHRILNEQHQITPGVGDIYG